MAKKFKDSDSRKTLCRQYCEHIENGFSDDSFPECDIETFKNFSEKYPKDFPPDAIASSQRIRLKFWEKKGIEGDINATFWIFNMRSRFRWSDKQVIIENEKREEKIVVEIVKK